MKRLWWLYGYRLKRLMPFYEHNARAAYEEDYERWKGSGPHFMRDDGEYGSEDERREHFLFVADLLVGMKDFE